ncbi:MAG: hypothetical protein IAC42_02475 [Spirochaetes bacterium]|uniref:Uncharacterized protein n=1 Tax=Candidatus Aphodenecus pullistercoris TaxID=2840669 RepID=A0A9D9E9K8_9SPIR|nr:hypothetical protein [Candidatus Aphodenecus pullistercoris]
MTKRYSIGKVLQTVFSGVDGHTALYWLANECGYFETDPAKIRPELLALFNKIMYETGAYLPKQAGVLIKKITEAMDYTAADEYRKETEDVV